MLRHINVSKDVPLDNKRKFLIWHPVYVIHKKINSNRFSYIYLLTYSFYFLLPSYILTSPEASSIIGTISSAQQPRAISCNLHRERHRFLIYSHTPPQSGAGLLQEQKAFSSRGGRFITTAISSLLSVGRAFA